jgi:GNAT superfamily N-acetyltransferase
VRDDWQLKGIGTDLLTIITDIAKKRGVSGIDANVLSNNHNMLQVFYNSGYKVSTKLEEDMYIISFDIKEK